MKTIPACQSKRYWSENGEDYQKECYQRINDKRSRIEHEFQHFSEKAMHRLFQIFRQYDGHLFECQDKDGNDIVGISFGTLALMRSWLDRYEEFLQEVEKCNEIKDVKKRGEALLKAESDFNLWMDIYPESEPFSMNLQIQKSHDEFMDKIGLNPKNQK